MLRLHENFRRKLFATENSSTQNFQKRRTSWIVTLLSLLAYIFNCCITLVTATRFHGNCVTFVARTQLAFFRSRKILRSAEELRKESRLGKKTWGFSSFFPTEGNATDLTITPTYGYYTKRIFVTKRCTCIFFAYQIHHNDILITISIILI